MEEKNINIFNRNFYCDNIKSLINSYKTKDEINLFNNKVILRTEKYLHPLFMNYNYCFFCYNKRKTKYFTKNLINSHIDDRNIFNFMQNKHIKLKKGKNKKEKIIRRFIHSYDLEKNEIITNRQYYDSSDTELYIENNNNNIKNENKINKKSDKTILDVKPIENKNIYKSNNIPQNKNSIIIESNNKNSNKDSNSISKEISLEEINLNINEINRKRKKTFYSLFSITKLKSEVFQKKMVLEENKAESKLNDKNNKKLNKSSDLLVLSEDVSNNSPGYLSILKHFALNNIDSLKKNVHRKKKFSVGLREVKNNKFKREIELNNNYKLKNENCSICLCEIREKFTLICGDFFCKECIYNVVNNCLIDISRFDKMVCPLCNEIIDDNTLKKLLNEKEYIFYKKTNLKIKGLKDKNLIPCPYPDCEGFAEKSTNNKNNIFYCLNNHCFCGKCMEVIDKYEKKHKCIHKYEENLKYLHSQKNIRKCPNCNCWVQKEEKGCNNMTCSNIWCNYEFCWICGGIYDENHYKNPLSMCFGLAASDPENDFTRGKGIRFIRCVFIFLLIIFILLPFLIIFFSLIEMIIYIIVFVLDGSALKYIRLKTKYAHRLFYKIAILFYFWLSLALIPVGYMSLAVIIIIIPFIFLIKKFKREDEYE